MWKSIAQLRRTTIIAIGLLAFLVGLGLARRIYCDSLTVILVALLFLVTVWKRNMFSLAVFVMLMLVIGVWRGSIYMRKIAIYKQLARAPVIIRGIADTDAVYGEKSQIAFDLAHMQLIDPMERPLVGKLTVKGFGEPMVYRGDTVQVEGKLYPTRGSKQAVTSFAQLKVLHTSSSKIADIRRRFSAGITSALPEPLGSFGLGLLIGQRSTIPKNLNDQLSVVGLTHIVAVSGYNLTIIVLVVHRLTQKRSKYQAFVATTSLIGLFILLTGTSASIVRAAIVSMLSLCSWYYGRSVKPFVLLLLAGAVTAGWYPPYIWSDLGWWLSFLAFAGVMIVGPLFEQRFLATRKPKLVMQVLIETTAAQIMTVPLIMFTFGRLSLISLLANVLVVPLIPLAMLLCLIAGLAGMLIAPVAGWFAWPGRLLMNYIVDIVRIMSRFPHAAIVRSMALQHMLALYGVVGFVLIVWWKKIPKQRTITDRKHE